MMLSKTKDNELAQQMLHLVVPIAIQQFMLALVSATDALMLGFVDQTSLFCRFSRRAGSICSQSLCCRHCWPAAAL